MRQVLLIADIAQQYYFQPFVAPCVAKGVRVYLFDPTSFPTSATVNVRLNKDGVPAGHIDVLECLPKAFSPKRLDLQEVDLAWYLRATKPVPRNAANELEARFTQSEASAALDSLYAVLPCRWVNQKSKIRFLECNKLFQQFVALRCGLQVPASIISNHPESVFDFKSPGEENLLLKTMGYTQLDDAGKYFIYSQLFSKEELRQRSAGIRACPVFVQEYIPKKWEYRVMVIGRCILACRIDSQASKSTKIDWRHYDFENVSHTAAELPVELQARLQKFMDAVGLRYGAIDLIETPEGDHVFLEVNPSGQWEWIAVLAGLPIPEAVAEMLATD